MRILTIGDGSEILQALPKSPIKEPLKLETVDHSLLALIVPPDAQDIVKRYYAKKLIQTIDRVSAKVNLTEKEVEELLEEDD